MAQVMVNFRMDEATKTAMDAICKELGLNASIAYNMFAKKVVREKRIPFEINLDPFYSESNIRALKHSLEQARNGEIVTLAIDDLDVDGE